MAKRAGASAPIAVMRSVMICDLVREEDSGQHIIIGTYDDNIVASTKPGYFAGMMIGSFELVAGGAHEIEFRIATPTSQGSGTVRTRPEAPANAYVPFAVPIPIWIEDVGSVTFEWRVNEGEWSWPVRWSLSFSEPLEALSEEQSSRMKALFDAQLGVLRAQ